MAESSRKSAKSTLAIAVEVSGRPVAALAKMSRQGEKVVESNSTVQIDIAVSTAEACHQNIDVPRIDLTVLIEIKPRFVGLPIGKRIQIVDVQVAITIQVSEDAFYVNSESQN